MEFLGELEQADRDRLFAESYASLMPGSWPEPFGLVAIEALACGTPVIARRIGALPEIIRDGVDGFFGDDVRPRWRSRSTASTASIAAAIRASVLERFSAGRMTDGYLDLYRALTRTDDEEMTGTDASGGGPVEPITRLPTPRQARPALGGSSVARK